VSRKMSVKAVETAMKRSQEREIALVLQKEASVETPARKDLADTAVIAKIIHIVRVQEGLLRVMVEGLRSAKIDTVIESGNGLEAGLDDGEDPWDPALILKDAASEDPAVYGMKMAEAEASIRLLKELVTSYAVRNGGLSQEVLNTVLELRSLPAFVHKVCAVVTFTADQKQSLLDTGSFRDTVQKLAELLQSEIEIGAARKELQDKIREKVDKDQKDYLLREQLRAIREELGETTDEDEEIADLKKRTEELDAPEEVKEAIRGHIRRYEKMPVSSPDSNVLYNYLDTLLSMPWNKESKDRSDLSYAKEILERDHYGLADVKERVLEFLAVRQLTGQGKSPILCLIGPPGTGKTSIGRSVAEALGKQYVRVSLGGVHDEAEIRGHRRTYIGAMPGRIAAALKKAGVSNPLMMLDEVDKVGSDHRGDVASALLEALDSEQNSRFVDHFIDLPLDLSRVLFIATANTSETIPAPLLDRMEVIRIAGYTEQEKMHIAWNHLIPKVRENNGLTAGQLSFTKEAVTAIIQCYTRESGVRQLERVLGQICRKAARQILEDGKKRVRVTEKSAVKMLGTPLYRKEKKNDRDEVGVVRGLAWTAVGGTTMPVEVSSLPGKGDLVLTGQLGNVMQESAKTGISYVRSVAEKYSIAQDYFRSHDLHIHVPEGAVPKDGPSAGITMATAILSAVTERPVKADLAMTGEITLRGRVLAIGGLKEKLLAAKMAGIGTVIVPEENRPNVSDIDAEITNGMRIIYAKTMEEVAGAAILGNNA
ncbi:MAG: endopeptidase La, partial [Lachnospiraceae bacterium]|nr:endopeptidase La [Lachnospiraceae bacterium]